MVKRELRKKHTALIAPAAILAGVAIWTIWGNTALELTQITVTSPRLPPAFSGCRIAHISDLHNAEFGEGNGKLLALLREAAPDAIVITGDMIDSRRTDMAVAIAFAREAVKIAPCCYVPGNHESRIASYPVFEDSLRDCGVVVLRNESIEWERGGETVTLLGLDDPAFTPLDGAAGETASMMSARLAELRENAPGYTMLLCHRPELFEVYRANGVNLAFSGHAHGGQVRLPFIGGIAAPAQGFFPKYDAGLYTDGDTAMVVSRGLGNSLIPLRFNNRPEVVLVTLQKA